MSARPVRSAELMIENDSRASARIRPDTIAVPRPGQISVWDFPRPPRVEPVNAKVAVVHGGVVIASSDWALRVCETAHPPWYFFPPSDVRTDLLRRSRKKFAREYIGDASLWSIKLRGHSVDNAAWSFAKPGRGYESIRGHVAFFPRLVDECWVGNQRAEAQKGEWGGWITPDLTGPFKGEPGSEAW